VGGVGFEVITEPTEEPITLALAKSFARLDDSGSPPSHPLDDVIEDVLIPAAREYAEDYTGLALAEKTVLLTLDEFPVGGIVLKAPPLGSVETVKYIDPDGALQTMDSLDYYIDTTQVPPWILPAYGTAWPDTQATANAVQITYECGYAAEDIPARAKLAMLHLIAHGIEHPEAVSERQMYDVPQTVDNLLSQLRIQRGVA
jgi:uncharacterized phiE125 gp8 family phage protein